jgi:hypothetical protein
METLKAWKHLKQSKACQAKPVSIPSPSLVKAKLVNSIASIDTLQQGPQKI